ncbi:hypothetical protein HID58_085727, partial [Brassica napus]
YDSPPYLKKAKPIAGSASEKNTQYLSTKVVISAPALLCPLASYKLQYLAILKSRAEHLFEVINSRDDVLRTLMGRCTYLRYVETGLTDRVLYADEILKYGFCLNVIKTSLCPLEVLKNVQEACLKKVFVQILLMAFTRVNGINKQENITMLDKYGGENPSSAEQKEKKTEPS